MLQTSQKIHTNLREYPSLPEECQQTPPEHLPPLEGREELWKTRTSSFGFPAALRLPQGGEGLFGRCELCPIPMYTRPNHAESGAS